MKKNNAKNIGNSVPNSKNSIMRAFFRKNSRSRFTTTELVKRFNTRRLAKATAYRLINSRIQCLYTLGVIKRVAPATYQYNG